MNTLELEQELRDHHIREAAYDLHGGHLPERHTLAFRKGKWSVYYSVEGVERDWQAFPTETEACECLLRKVLADPSARKFPSGLAAISNRSPEATKRAHNALAFVAGGQAR